MPWIRTGIDATMEIQTSGEIGPSHLLRCLLRLQNPEDCGLSDLRRNSTRMSVRKSNVVVAIVAGAVVTLLAAWIPRLAGIGSHRTQVLSTRVNGTEATLSRSYGSTFVEVANANGRDDTIYDDLTYLVLSNQFGIDASTDYFDRSELYEFDFSPSSSSVVFEFQGIPLRCLSCKYIWDTHLYGVIEPPLRAVAGLRISRMPGFAGASGANYGKVIALRPMVVPLLINCVFWTLMMAMMWWAVKALIRKRRLQLNLCPFCSYPRASVRGNSMCSECGRVSARSLGRSPGESPLASSAPPV